MYLEMTHATKKVKQDSIDSMLQNDTGVLLLLIKSRVIITQLLLPGLSWWLRW